MNNKDTIYRQAAIDALLYKGQSSRRYKLGETWELNLDEITEAIGSVPSAQLEHNPNDERKIADLHEKVNYLYDRLKEQFIYVDYLISRVKQQWVPVTEGLPKKSGQYYVSGGDKVWICEFLIIPNGTGGWCNDARNPAVQAWMPLPQSYKVKSEKI